MRERLEFSRRGQKAIGDEGCRRKPAMIRHEEKSGDWNTLKWGRNTQPPAVLVGPSFAPGVKTLFTQKWSQGERPRMKDRGLRIAGGCLRYPRSSILYS